MELWIRSQDKKRITKIDDIYLVHDDDNFCDYIGNTKIGHLAKYTKEGRALEVLDEIQKILLPKAIMQQVKLDEYELKLIPEIYVYQMPKE